MGRWKNDLSFPAVVLLATTSAFLPPEPLVAQDPPEAASAMATTTISACYVPASGTLYIIDEPGLATGCVDPDHVPLQWSFGGDSGNTPGTVVERDENGGFTAGPVSLTTLSVAGEATAGNGMVTLREGGGIVALGPTSFLDDSGTPLGVSGPGARMFWYPRIQAFRAGFVEEDRWDEGNLGEQSAAFGFNTLASGPGSFAAGVGSGAEGLGSTALGFGVRAGQHASFAAGQATRAIGRGSTALGNRSEAAGDGATALGESVLAWGDASLAAGRGNRAEGLASVALGVGSIARGIGAFSLGPEAEASGPHSVAMGPDAYAGAPGSFALGVGASASGEGAFALGTGIIAAHDGSYVFGNQPLGAGLLETTTDHQFVVRAQHIWLGQDNNVPANPVNFLDTSTGAFLTTGGAWTNASDEARKHHFEDVEAEWALGRLTDLPVREWSYRAEGAGVRHLGPTAQDFYAAFGLGGSDRAISTVDADGVALLAIQALERRTRELEAENAALRKRLEDENAEIRARMATLEAALPNGRR